MPKPVTLTFHHDPGHGWLEVPVETFLLAGAKFSRISPYSYAGVKGFVPYLYLEEDCDAFVFLQAAEQAGMKVTVQNQMHPGECFVRQLGDIPFATIKAKMESAGMEF